MSGGGVGGFQGREGAGGEGLPASFGAGGALGAGAMGANAMLELRRQQNNAAARMAFAGGGGGGAPSGPGAGMLGGQGHHLSHSTMLLAQQQQQQQANARMFPQESMALHAAGGTAGLMGGLDQQLMVLRQQQAARMAGGDLMASPGVPGAGGNFLGGHGGPPAPGSLLHQRELAEQHQQQQQQQHLLLQQAQEQQHFQQRLMIQAAHQQQEQQHAAAARHHMASMPSPTFGSLGGVGPNAAIHHLREQQRSRLAAQEGQEDARKRSSSDTNSISGHAEAAAAAQNTSSSPVDDDSDDKQQKKKRKKGKKGKPGQEAKEEDDPSPQRKKGRPAEMHSDGASESHSPEVEDDDIATKMKKKKEKTEKAPEFDEAKHALPSELTLQEKSADMDADDDLDDASTASAAPSVMVQNNASVIAKHLGDYPMTKIRTPNQNDVLCGRGGGTNNHYGNEAFRQLVNRKKREYLNCSKRDKPLVSRSIVETIRLLTPPGRFLQKDETTGLWYDIGDQKAREKTSQALREGAPVIRREITMAGVAAAAANAGGPQRSPFMGFPPSMVQSPTPHAMSGMPGAAPGSAGPGGLQTHSPVTAAVSQQQQQQALASLAPPAVTSSGAEAPMAPLSQAAIFNSAFVAQQQQQLAMAAANAGNPSAGLASLLSNPAAKAQLDQLSGVAGMSRQHAAQMHMDAVKSGGRLPQFSPSIADEVGSGGGGGGGGSLEVGAMQEHQEEGPPSRSPVNDQAQMASKGRKVAKPTSKQLDSTGQSSEGSDDANEESDHAESTCMSVLAAAASAKDEKPVKPEMDHSHESQVEDDRMQISRAGGLGPDSDPPHHYQGVSSSLPSQGDGVTSHADAESSRDEVHGRDSNATKDASPTVGSDNALTVLPSHHLCRMTHFEKCARSQASGNLSTDILALHHEAASHQDAGILGCLPQEIFTNSGKTRTAAAVVEEVTKTALNVDADPAQPDEGMQVSVLPVVSSSSALSQERLPSGRAGLRGVPGEGATGSARGAALLEAEVVSRGWPRSTVGKQIKDTLRCIGAY